MKTNLNLPATPGGFLQTTPIRVTSFLAPDPGQHKSRFVFGHTYLPGFLLLGVLVFLFSSCYSYHLDKPAGLIADRFRPVFIIPACDAKNPLEKVYFSFKTSSGDSVLEISLVFKDEDQPFFLTDAAYDLYRHFKFHRKKDIETLYLHFDAPAGLLKYIDFGDAYSGDQRFLKPVVKHFHAQIPAARIVLEQGRPLIYINTWNHLFSEKDTNPELVKTAYRIYSCMEGSRSDAEPVLRGK